MRFVSVGSVAVLLGAVASMLTGSADARGFRPLYHFQGGADGDGSVNRLTIDDAGNLYGVTTANDTVLGTVFMVSPGGTETVLHSFSFFIGHASVPTGGVTMDADGNLYGDARNGGQYFCTDNDLLNADCGSLYKLAPDGTMTTIHSFQGGDDGGLPQGGLLLDSDGNLYGTTKYGGTGNFCAGGCGTVFRLAPDGTLTVLHNFTGQGDGSRPTSSLIADANHNLYGTAPLGGQGFGLVFRIAPDGTKTDLHAFNGSDGAQPSGALAIDQSGNLYGTTPTGGNSGGGAVYRLATDGTLTVLHNFSDGDGVYPTGGVLLDGKGSLYGTTLQGGKDCGSYGCGTVFRIAKDGTYSQIYKFKGRTGYNPFGGLVVDGVGNLYGSALGPYADPAHLGILFSVRK